MPTAIGSSTRLLRAHVGSDGLVWYGDDATSAACLGVDVAGCSAVLDSGALGYRLDDVERIRVLGTRNNAALLNWLFARDGSRVIEIGSPMICHTSERVGDPVVALNTTWRLDHTSRLHGQWHRMTAKDAASYALAVEVDDNGRVSGLAEARLRSHPAWPALSFVAGGLGVDLTAACRLVVDVLDPRWYWHPERPHRLSRLYSHLGLTPTNVKALLGQGRPSRHFPRCVSAVGVWRHAAALAAFEDGRCTESEHFLWRICAAKPSPLGVLTATRKLVSLLFHTWLCATVARCHPEVRFMPEKFFLRGDEARAFEEKCRGTG